MCVLLLFFFFLFFSSGELGRPSYNTLLPFAPLLGSWEALGGEPCAVYRRADGSWERALSQGGERRGSRREDSTPCIFRVSFAFRHGDGESLPCLLKCGFFSKKSCQIASRNRVNSAHATLYILFFFVGFHLSLSSLPFVFSSRTRATDGAPQDTVFLLWCLETRKSSLVHRTSDGMWTRGLTHGQHALTRF